MTHILAGVLGLFIVLVTWHSLLRTLVVPRGSSKLIYVKSLLVLRAFQMVARRSKDYKFRDRILLWASPFNIFSSLLTWLFLFFIGYALMMFAFGSSTLLDSFRESGSSLFTLGFVATDFAGMAGLDFIAAATGPITIGLLIGYLPTMYTAYQRRESEVTLMLARAGEPNWGPELLARYAMVGMAGKAETLWPRWERWVADVGESHTNFPVLVHMRSSRPNRNWLVSLLCVMDAAAMHVALNPSMPRRQARLLLGQGVVCLQELAEAERLNVTIGDPDTFVSEVTEEEFIMACLALKDVDYHMERTPQEAYADFQAWRSSYEPIAYALAQRIDAVPAPWSGPRKPPLPVIYPTRPTTRAPGE